MTWRLGCLIVAMLLFLAGAFIEFGWLGVSGDHPLGFVALGLAFFAAAHLPARP